MYVFINRNVHKNFQTKNPDFSASTRVRFNTAWDKCGLVKSVLVTTAIWMRRLNEHKLRTGGKGFNVLAYPWLFINGKAKVVRIEMQIPQSLVVFPTLACRQGARRTLARHKYNNVFSLQYTNMRQASQRPDAENNCPTSILQPSCMRLHCFYYLFCYGLSPGYYSVEFRVRDLLCSAVKWEKEQEKGRENIMYQIGYKECSMCQRATLDVNTKFSIPFLHFPSWTSIKVVFVSYSLIEFYHCFRGHSCLHHQGD